LSIALVKFLFNPTPHCVRRRPNTSKHWRMIWQSDKKTRY